MATIALEGCVSNVVRSDDACAEANLLRKHCNNVYARINSAKAFCHVLKITGTQNVAACKQDIPVMYLHCYEDLYSWQHHGKEAKAEEIVARSNKTSAWQD